MRYGTCCLGAFGIVRDRSGSRAVLPMPAPISTACVCCLRGAQRRCPPAWWQEEGRLARRLWARGPAGRGHTILFDPRRSRPWGSLSQILAAGDTRTFVGARSLPNLRYVISSQTITPQPTTPERNGGSAHFPLARTIETTFAVRRNFAWSRAHSFPLCWHSSGAPGELRAESSSLVLTAGGRRTLERSNYCSARCSPELTSVGVCSLRFLGLWAVQGYLAHTKPPPPPTTTIPQGPYDQAYGRVLRGGGLL